MTERCDRYSQIKSTINALQQFVDDKIKSGSSAHLLTFLYPQLLGNSQLVRQNMATCIERFYSLLVTRLHRRPKAADASELPILLGSFDLPAYKHNRSSAPSVFVNSGLHVHAVLLLPRQTRLKEPLANHIEKYRPLYTANQKLIQTIDVRPIAEAGGTVIDYIFKTIKRGRIAYDDGVILLPRAASELA